VKTYQDLIQDCLNDANNPVGELFPWDLAEVLENGEKPLLLDIREPYEFNAIHIQHSINVPRGILESACEYNFEDTVPELVEARDKEIIVICRSGNRSVLAAYTMQLMGYQSVKSLKTGVKGWNDFEQPLYNKDQQAVDGDDAFDILNPPLRPEQLTPK